MSQHLFARHALLAQGWAKDVYLAWDGQGYLTQVQTGMAAPQAETVHEWVLPGMINLHSHAFQRAMAGLTEVAGAGSRDSFWTWRDLMYRFARHIRPAHVQAIAAQLYAECLRHGYTSVCEFHYVQRAENGSWYADPAEMAKKVVAAGRDSGIGLTMLPVLYSWAGFGEQPLRDEQARFRTDVDDVLRIVHALEDMRGPQLEVGAAPHSLRAASIAQIHALQERMPGLRPMHIHIAEQQKEVQDCLDWCGQRPLQLLLNKIEVDQRWCMVHATHLNQHETDEFAASGAVAGLCPTTEANLGDGLFPLSRYLELGGQIGIGSDSHVSQSPIEELRWLEYGQRLQHQARNIAIRSDERSVGDFLWQACLRGGAQASGRAVGSLQIGRRADLLVLDEQHPNLACASPAEVLNILVFCGNEQLVRDVMVGGQWRVRARQHWQQEQIAQRYIETLRELKAIAASAA